MYKKDKVKVSVAGILLALVGAIWLWKGSEHLYLKIASLSALLIWLVAMYLINKKYS